MSGERRGAEPLRIHHRDAVLPTEVHAAIGTLRVRDAVELIARDAIGCRVGTHKTTGGIVANEPIVRGHPEQALVIGMDAVNAGHGHAFGRADDWCGLAVNAFFQVTHQCRV